MTIMKPRFIRVATAILAGAFVHTPASVHASDDLRLQLILQDYVSAMGGRAALERIDSLRIRGRSVGVDGQTQQISLIKKRPNQVRIYIRMSNMDITLAHDGSVAWQVVETHRGRRLTEITGMEKLSFLRKSIIGSLLLEGPPIVESVQYVGPGRFGGQDCHVIQVNFPDGSFSRYYIDAREHVERRIVEYPTGNPDEPGFTHIPSDYRKVEGVLVAFRTVRRSGDEFVSETTIDSVEINAGVMDRFFLPPEDLEFEE